MSQTLAVDTHSLIFRSFYAAQSGGADTAVALGIFQRMLGGVLEGVHPQYVVAAKDPGGATFRHELDPDYKGSRGPTPDGLKEMIPAAVALLDRAGIPVLSVDGYEADDVLATLAEQIKPGHRLTVLSSDRDLVGLVKPGVDLLLLQGGGKQKRVHCDNAHEVFGVPAWQVADYKALVGDASDNIPGVRGIGPKTAVQLLETHQDLERILAARDSLPAKVVKLLDEEGVRQAQLCQQLAQLHCQVPLEFDARAARWDWEKLNRLMDR